MFRLMILLSAISNMISCLNNCIYARNLRFPQDKYMKLMTRLESLLLGNYIQILEIVMLSCSYFNAALTEIW